MLDTLNRQSPERTCCIARSPRCNRVRASARRAPPGASAASSDDAQRVRLGVDDVRGQVERVVVGEEQQKVLERLGDPEGLHRVVLAPAALDVDVADARVATARDLGVLLEGDEHLPPPLAVLGVLGEAPQVEEHSAVSGRSKLCAAPIDMPSAPKRTNSGARPVRCRAYIWAHVYISLAARSMCSSCTSGMCCAPSASMPGTKQKRWYIFLYCSTRLPVKSHSLSRYS